MEYAVVIVYDISDDQVRRKVEKICKNYGLSHVQRSLFVGIMEEEQRRAIYHELEKATLGLVGDTSIRIYRINLNNYEKTYKIGFIDGFDDDPEPERVIV